MLYVNVTSLKAKLSEKLAEVREGASFIVTDRRTPIARLVPVEAEDSLLVERKAEGAFRPVRAPQSGAVNLDWRSLLEIERGGH